MAIEVTCAEARRSLARLIDRVEREKTVVYIRRGPHARVALVAADELASLLETAYLMRSPRNARRHLSAMQRALRPTRSGTGSAG